MAIEKTIDGGFPWHIFDKPKPKPKKQSDKKISINIFNFIIYLFKK